MVTLPVKDVNMGGARLLPGAVLEAVAFLELARPVTVKWAGGLRRRGCHRTRAGGHVITVSTYLEAEQASRTLWHELIHAAQAEREDDFDAAYDRADRMQGYRNNRYEVEARTCGDDFHAGLALAR